MLLTTPIYFWLIFFDDHQCITAAAAKSLQNSNTVGNGQSTLNKFEFGFSSDANTFDLF